MKMVAVVSAFVETISGSDTYEKYVLFLLCHSTHVMHVQMRRKDQTRKHYDNMIMIMIPPGCFSRRALLR